MHNASSSTLQIPVEWSEIMLIIYALWLNMCICTCIWDCCSEKGPNAHLFKIQFLVVHILEV